MPQNIPTAKQQAANDTQENNGWRNWQLPQHARYAIAFGAKFLPDLTNAIATSGRRITSLPSKTEEVMPSATFSQLAISVTPANATVASQSESEIGPSPPTQPHSTSQSFVNFPSE